MTLVLHLRLENRTPVSIQDSTATTHKLQHCRAGHAMPVQPPASAAEELPAAASTSSSTFVLRRRPSPAVSLLCRLSSFTMAAKTIYLIRHAESEENRRMDSLREVGRSIGRLSLPSWEDVSSSMELVEITSQVDSAVSTKGAEQIKRMGEKLASDSFAMQLDLIVHSPLQRAKMTCKGMLGVAADEDTRAGQRVVSLDLLREKLLSEWVPGNTSLGERISSFEAWLANQPEDKVAVVGHSQYFKSMLLLDFKFGNCDVWKLTFDPNNSEAKETIVDGRPYRLPAQWTALERMYSGSEST